jgi:hypothetical protein
LRRLKGGSLVQYVLLVLLVQEKKEGGLDARLFFALFFLKLTPRMQSRGRQKD